MVGDRRSDTPSGRGLTARSRPKVKLLLSPALVTPGTRLLVETVLAAKTQTPIDFVSMILRCNVSTVAVVGGKAPSSPDDPTVSAVARATWRDLVSRIHAVHVERDAVLVELEGRVADPGEVMPVELAISLRRALAGIRGAGPFR